jgi:hypothetical protein
MATTSAPPAPTRSQIPRPPSSKVRVPQLAVGLLLTAGTALAFLLWNAASVERAGVLALATDVERGHVVALEDLRIVYVGTDDPIAVTDAEASAELIGRAANSDLPAGTLVTTAQLTAGPALTPGAGVVGLALAPGEYPTPYLSIGDVVDVLDVGGDGPPTVLVESAEVVWVEGLGTQGQRFISVQTDEAAAALTADVAARGDVRLVLVADRPSGEAGP